MPYKHIISTGSQKTKLWKLRGATSHPFNPSDWSHRCLEVPGNRISKDICSTVSMVKLCFGSLLAQQFLGDDDIIIKWEYLTFGDSREISSRAGSMVLWIRFYLLIYFSQEHQIAPSSTSSVVSSSVTQRSSTADRGAKLLMIPPQQK